jgi:hypothetical protein
MYLLPHEIAGNLVWNAIVVIDSLPDKTGKELVDSKLRWLSEKHGYGLGYAYTYDLKSMHDEIQDVLRQVEENGVIPILHFEMHGSTKGLELESGEILGWDVLGTWFRAINVLTKNRLMVVLALCHGTEAVNQIIPFLPAPFRCLIAPEGKVSFGLIEEGFDAFYDEIHNGIVGAVSALNKHRDDTGFFYLDPTFLFHQAWDNLRNQYDTPGKVNQLLDYLIEIGFIGSAIPVFNEKALRDWWVRCLCGEDSVELRWQAYRLYMMATDQPDEGPNSGYRLE